MTANPHHPLSPRSKARSRLPQSAALQPSSPSPSRSRVAPNLLQRYRRHLPTLGVSLPFWFAVVWIVWHIPPESIANWGWPNSYLPLVGSLWLALVWSGSFVLLKTRRGVTLASWLVVLLWSRWLQLEPGLWMFFWTGLCWGLELLLELLDRILPTHTQNR